MQLTLHMRLTGAALSTDDGAADGTELARILHQLADQFDGELFGPITGPLIDVNGNMVGNWAIVRLRDDL